LNSEKWIARSLLVDQLRQRSNPFRFAVKRIRNQLSQVFESKRSERDFMYDSSRIPELCELAHQGMSRIDFVVPISADRHQVPYIPLSQQVLEQIQRCRVEPLQIVEEQRQRMFQPREHVDKPPEY